MDVAEYKRCLAKLSEKFNGICQCCGKNEGTSCRWIMPPGRRVIKEPKAMAYLCDECLKKGQSVYPWWRGEYGE